MLQSFRLTVVCTAVLLATAQQLQAGIITSGAFGTGTVLVDYDGLGLPLYNPTPLTIAGDSYTTDTSNLSYAGPVSVTGSSGEVIITQTDLGFINVVLGTPVLRAGATFGTLVPWTASISFFDESDTLLGTIGIGGSAGEGIFAGWEADSGLIKRIRAVDTSANGRTLMMDNLLKEEAQLVPEPTSIVLWGIGTVAMTIGAARRRRREKQTTAA